MSRRAKNNQQTEKAPRRTAPPTKHQRSAAGKGGLPANYWNACELVKDGQYAKARALYARLERSAGRPGSRLRVLIQNDLAVIAAMEGKFDEACQGWRAAVEGGSECLPARLNLGLVEAELVRSVPAAGAADLKIAPAPEEGEPRAADGSGSPPAYLRAPPSPTRVAVISFLFNWPSTGGGNMHTAGLVEFLGRDGYEVRHFYARYPAWGIGRVGDEGYALGATRETCGHADGGDPPGARDPRRTGGEDERETSGQADGGVGDPRRTGGSEAVEFGDGEWNVATIRQRFRSAVDSFGPDYVVISDTWNMKPHLAEAMRGYPTLLMEQAQECLCPLNNLRLIGVGPAQVEQCPRNQLATPMICHQCLAERGHHAGALHQAERALAGVGTAEYDRILRQSFFEAEAVLVLNPITAAMLEPYARRVCVVPWGVDPARFSWTVQEKEKERDTGQASATQTRSAKRVLTLFMAAVAGEVIKGFHVAHEACRILRETRNDFELVVTFDPAGTIDGFTRSVGWCSQGELPEHYRAADICVVPTIAQDALSITSVEAMAAGKPVVGSRIGGLPYTVNDGVTGLLFEPGNPFDMAEKLGRLLDDPSLRRETGLAGRARFEEDFVWEEVIKRYWRPLLSQRASRSLGG